ncbi:MAG TPA: dihydroneopterin aldolase, partial [Thermoleophilia bacterium]|nr:dihydroneopterin aldolase [Thermoleophilia bacterium]
MAGDRDTRPGPRGGGPVEGRRSGPARRRVEIALEGLEAPCHIGVTDEERREAQTLLVDVRLAPLLASGPAEERTSHSANGPSGVAGSPAGDYAADDLAETVDYGAVAAVAVATAAERPYRLLERLATEIADRLWAGHELAELRVAVRKPSPPVGAPALA